MVSNPTNYCLYLLIMLTIKITIIYINIDKNIYN